jgi:amino acid adenylation domain-containing protein
MTRLMERVAEQARVRRNHTALVSRGGKLSFAEIEEQSSRIAAALIRNCGAAAESVATLIRDPLRQAVVFLGCAKAGKRFVPIDPDFPDARVQFIAADAEARLVVTDDRAGAGRLGSSGPECLEVTNLLQEAGPADTAAHLTESSDLWIVYTSGSTGTPKGLRQNHRNLNRYMEHYGAGFELRQNDVLVTAFSFHVNGGLHDLLIALTHGITIAPWDIKTLGPAGLSAWIREQGATIASMVPTAFRSWMEHVRDGEQFPNVRLLRLWGEGSFRRDFDLFRRHFSDSCRLVNRLGSSETGPVCWNFLHRSDTFEGPRIPVGRATEDHTLWVEGECGEKLNGGEIGEIVVRSRYIFPGYWKRKEQTEAVLRADPESPEIAIYRTGDMGFFSPNGQLVATGRKGKMVKIRGYLVALDEIEQSLAAHPDIRDAVVNTIPVDDDSGAQRVVGYYVSRDHEIPSNRLREHCRRLVPEYMVPDAFVCMPSFPLAPNGKVARNSLPRPSQGRPKLEVPYAATETPLQADLVAIWEEVLEVAPIGIDDDFLDLGGTSLDASTVLARIERDCGGAVIDLVDFFDDGTVRKLSARFKAPDRPAAKPLLPELVRRGGGPKAASSSQRSLWFLEQLVGSTAVYNICRAWRVQGQFDLDAWKRALARVAERHEVLRTVLVAVDGAPYQQVRGVDAEEAQPPVTILDLQSTPPAQRLSEAGRFLEAKAARPFRLDSDAMLRSAVAILNAKERLVLIAVHHVASDGWSMDILLRELHQAYSATEATQEDPGLQFGDFSEWQRECLESGAFDAEVEYWRKQLDGLAHLELPADFPRPARMGVTGSREYFQLSPRLSQSLKQCAHDLQTTPFVIAMAAYVAMLARYTGSDDIAVAFPTAGRTHASLEPLIGFFVNTLILRVRLSDGLTFRELAARVREETLGALSHQHIPFEQLVETLRPQRDLNHTPMADVFFVMQAPADPLQLPGAVCLPYRVQTRTAKLDLSIILEPQGNGYNGILEYSTELFRTATARRMCDHYLRLLEALAGNPGTRIAEAPLLSAAESAQVLDGWNGAGRPIPEGTIGVVFAQCAAAHATGIAVRSDTLAWTYRELDERSTGVARALQKAGVRPGEIVAMLMERSPYSVAAMLGILKCGAAYLPLYPDDPANRLEFQLKDCGVRVVVGEGRFRDRCERPPHWIDVEEAAAAFGSAEAFDPPPVPHVHDGGLAYVNYTSGSTGTPKAVLIPHRAVLRLVFEQDYTAFGPTVNFLHMAPLAFDASTLEVWGSLLRGGTCTVSEGPIHDMGKLGEFLERHQVTSAWLTASLFNTFVDEAPQSLRSLRWLLTGGEALSVPHLRRAVRLLPDTQIVNGYGPTEATTFTCCFPIPRPEVPEGWTSAPIGRPVTNTEVFVLDPSGQPVPVLVPGELWIGGEGLSRGYLNQPELTATRFMELTIGGKPRRLYRSGDRVRWLPSGVLEYLGRFDAQVKIRGFRVEPGEIEDALNGHPAIRSVCVTASTSGTSGSTLTAFFAAVDGQRVDHGVLSRYLAERLPPYMVPAHFVPVPEIPLLSNGKVDRQKLLLSGGLWILGANASSAPEEPPLGIAEEKLAELWQSILGLEALPGRQSNFFDLGGHSLLALKLIAGVEREFGVKLSLASLFESPTIVRMAETLLVRPDPDANLEPVTFPAKCGIVTVQSLGQLPPFYCAGAGPMFWELANHLAPDQPFLSLTAPTRPVEAGYATLESLASDLARLIRQHQPRGVPYVVGGWCLAGILAYEVARALEAEGGEVARVILFDTPNLHARQKWMAPAPRTRWMQLMLAKTRYHCKELMAESLDDIPGYLKARASGVLEHVRSFRRAQEAREASVNGNGLQDIWMNFEESLMPLSIAYQPGPLRARVLQVRPKRRPQGAWYVPDFGWKDCLPNPGQIEVVEVPGNHKSMFHGGEARVLAEELKKRLRSAS